MKELTSQQMVINSLTHCLADAHCNPEEAVKQLLGRFYHQMTAKQAKTFMNRSIMLLEPKERDWLKSLY